MADVGDPRREVTGNAQSLPPLAARCISTSDSGLLIFELLLTVKSVILDLVPGGDPSPSFPFGVYVMYLFVAFLLLLFFGEEGFTA